VGDLQATRDLSITTPLGDDTLLIRSIRYAEQLGRPFHAELELVSSNFAIDLSQLVGQNVTVTYSGGQSPRYFNGYISFVAQADPLNRLGKYTATMVPWLWLLTRKSDCRIFQNQSVPSTIKQIFQEQGFGGEVVDKLVATYTPWEYCVQYRESDFNFVSRLMEHEGIYYYFTHVNGKHNLVLSDDPSCHQPYPGYATLTYSAGTGQYTKEHVHDWIVEQQLEPGNYALTDYDFKLPQKSLMSVSQVTRKNLNSNNQVYDYPGDYIAPSDGDEYTKIRIQELQVQYELARAITEIAGISAGFTFTLSEFPRADQNKQYLITGCNIEITSDQMASSTDGGTAIFQCGFTAMDAKQQFRPARMTPKPTVQGPQTALVVGPKGEEIYVDEFARVKVQFHWDRLGKKDENSSCWIRVAQIWAGKKWGGMFIPRIGQEVIVDFLEGDPDYPIVTGRVYNGDNKPPYDLPGGKTRSTVQSRSSKGGGPANFNEIRMEDAKGTEELYFHAEKDHTIIVEHDKNEVIGHDENETVGNNKTETVGNNETISIGVNRTEAVGSNESLAVGANRTRTVGASETVSVALMRTHNVGVNEAISVGAAQQINVGAEQTVNIGAIQSITVGADQSTNVGANQSNEVGANQSTNVGAAQSTSVGASRSITVGADQSSEISGGRTATVGKDDSLTVTKKLTINAGDQIIISTGDASILMKKDGTITISGKDISIEGSGKINIKADGNITMKGQEILQN